MDDLARAKKERDEHCAFAIEANDLLREVWNLGLFDDKPELKKRLGKLLQVEGGSYTV